MFLLAPYEELVRAFSDSVEEAEAAAAQCDYATLGTLLSRQEDLLHQHALMLEDLASMAEAPEGLPPEVLAATAAMTGLLERWAGKHPTLTETLRRAQEETREKLEHLSRGRELLHAYYPHAAPRSRFIDKHR